MENTSEEQEQEGQTYGCKAGEIFGIQRENSVHSVDRKKEKA